MSEKFKFEEINSEEWLNALPKYSQRLIHDLKETGKTEDEIATMLLTGSGADNTVGYGASSPQKAIFSAVKDEFKKLICGDNAYKKERSEIIKIWNSNKTLVISSISAAIGSVLGIATAVLAPVVCILLMIVTRMGLNLYCREDNGAAHFN